MRGIDRHDFFPTFFKIPRTIPSCLEIVFTKRDEQGRGSRCARSGSFPRSTDRFPFRNSPFAPWFGGGWSEVEFFRFIRCFHLLVDARFVSLRRINPKIARSSYECLTIALHRKRKHHDLSNDLPIFYIVCSHIKKFYEFFSLPPPDLHEIDGFFVSIFLYTSSYTSLYPFILHEN